MRVDAHQHFWHYNPREYAWLDDSMGTLRRDYTPADLAPHLAAAGFDACVTVQVRQTLEETQALLAEADASSFIAGVVGWADLQSPAVGADLERLARHRKLVGIRHIVQSEPDERFLLRPDFCRGVELLERFGLAYDILIYPRHLAVAEEFVGRFERQRFVLDHLAKPDIRHHGLKAWEPGFRRLAAHPNVYCKLSGLVTEADWARWTPQDLRPYLDVALDSFGPSRLMIGSDWPVCEVAADYARVMAVVTDWAAATLPADDQAGVLGGNATRFWNLQLVSARAGAGPIPGGAQWRGATRPER